MTTPPPSPASPAPQEPPELAYLSDGERKLYQRAYARDDNSSTITLLMLLNDARRDLAAERAANAGLREVLGKAHDFVASVPPVMGRGKMMRSICAALAAHPRLEGT